MLRSVSHSFGALALFAPSKLAALAWSGHALVLGAVATTPYWQGEVVGAVWVGSTLPMLFYVLTHPALLRRRIPRTEQAPRQKIIKALFALGGVVMYAGSFLSWALDYHVSSIPVPVALLGDLLIASDLAGVSHQRLCLLNSHGGVKATCDFNWTLCAGPSPPV